MYMTFKMDISCISRIIISVLSMTSMIANLCYQGNTVIYSVLISRVRTQFATHHVWWDVIQVHHCLLPVKQHRHGFLKAVICKITNLVNVHIAACVHVSPTTNICTLLNSSVGPFARNPNGLYYIHLLKLWLDRPVTQKYSAISFLFSLLLSLFADTMHMMPPITFTRPMLIDQLSP